eukprot:gene12770-26928_t
MQIHRATVFFTAWGLIILVPVYATASADYVDWKKYTLANVFDKNKERLWVTVFFGYLFTSYFCYLFYIEYRNFSLKNSLKRTLQGDSDTPSQTNYTVVVENIPPALRSGKALHTFLKNIFPDIYYQ